MHPRAQTIARFLREAGWGAAQAFPLPGDASTRRYTRLERNGETALLMDQPQNAETATAGADATPQERRRLGYNAIARLAGGDCGRFAAGAGYLKTRGLAAPEIYAGDLGEGLLLIEDLGNDLYTDSIAEGADERSLYEAAIDVLVRLHEEPAPEFLASGVPLFAYDETALIAETGLLTEWFLPAALGREGTPSEISEHEALWREALSSVAGKPVFVHRDYHAQNLIWRPFETGLERAGLIDFQDAVAGSPAYDLISLLEDARRDVPGEIAGAMTARYLKETRAEKEPFLRSAAILAAQRNAKIVGIFARLARRDRKPRYLAYLPRVWRYMEKDLAHPSLARLNAWYGRIIPKEARGVPAFAGAEP